ncbi:L,D-transpeptidase (plasmid) [Methylocystis sp. MJC1]|jgi:lipoprotein-anchoring transpeptidase ErfK/SrfK|uniref:L,D-transpeptidase n=1 Tax=Methylocystis sp. MJC1 TaxID=2654282 RepID=UPI0013EA2A1B|nr:L,D-transpeptidase [Methylocystis sp. MJC1]KAF2991480.1 putative L,D-transpeptidase ErfK/SrfK [Methylocystis sp. MJC1]MBU6529206.1 L,D-transpeptidase [Methylocystis sp. MJC1]UZX13886.1 L,D-transpeptidase [Methylocystis sp. MJC1]
MNSRTQSKLLVVAIVAVGLTGCGTTQSSIQNVVAFAAPPEPAPAAPAMPPDPVIERAPVETLPLEPPSRSASAGSDSVAPKYSAIYGEMRDGEHVVPAVKLTEISPQFLRKNVAYSTKEPPGAVVVDPANHFLYFVEDNGRATRYGVGVGREGFVWAGEASIKNKQEWPDWYPPKEMIERRSDLKAKMVKLQSGEGMHGGPSNPLGARAMYLWQGDKDTLFRIHGTNEPWTIGHSESSGCIRMINQDAIDLYNKIEPGARVLVLGSRGAQPVEKLSQR